MAFVDFNKKRFIKTLEERNHEAEKIVLVEGALNYCEEIMLSYQANLYFQKPFNQSFVARRLNKVIDEVQKKDVYQRSFYTQRTQGKTAQARVMFVDDEIEACEFLERHFRGPAAGGIYEVAISYNGAEAIQKAKKFRPDIVVTDIKMPGMRGTDMVSALRKLKHPPKDFILITAIDTRDQRERAEESRLPVFEKPVNLREITRVLQERAIALGLFVGSKEATRDKQHATKDKKRK
jgi:CheY-like chemotaxis protein